MTSDGELLAYRELDETLGLFDSVPPVISDSRSGLMDAIALFLCFALTSMGTVMEQCGFQVMFTALIDGKISLILGIEEEEC